MKSSRIIQFANPFLIFLLFIFSGCDEIVIDDKDQELFFGTVWKADKVDYFNEGDLVRSDEYISGKALYEHYFTDTVLWISVENGQYKRGINTYKYSDLHIDYGEGIPERVVTSIDNASMVIESDGLEHAIYPELYDYDHTTAYYSVAEESPLASSFEGEWDNYKMELIRDGKVVNTWELDTRIKYSKDGTVTYSNAETTSEGYYLLVDDKVVFSVNDKSVKTVKIDGDGMIQESYNPSLGTSRVYFRRVK